AAGHAGRLGLVFLDLADDRLGRQEQAADAGGVLQGAALHLRGDAGAHLDEVAVLVGQRVVAAGHVLQVFLDLLGDDAAVHAGVLGDLLQGRLDGPAHHLHADPLVLVGGRLLDAVERLGGGANDGGAPAGKDPFLDGGAAGVERVLDAGLLLLHGHLGGGADVDLRHAAGELGEALLALLAVVVAGGGVDLVLDLLDARLDLGLVAGALDDGGVVLVDAHLLGAPEVGQLQVLELDAQLLHDGGAAGQDGDVLEHGLAAVTEAGRLDGARLE